MAAVAAIAAAALASALPVGAKLHYRGFVEGGIGVTTVPGYDFSELQSDGGMGFGYMLATTHGIQLNKNFIGIGFGITPGYVTEAKWPTRDTWRLSRATMPFYANWRYDFFNTNSWTPYIGVKGGIFLTWLAGFGKSDFYDGEDHHRWGPCNAWPVFAAIDLGMRKNVSSTSGVSLGLSVQTASNYDLGISILAKVAFDF